MWAKTQVPRLADLSLPSARQRRSWREVSDPLCEFPILPLFSTKITSNLMIGPTCPWRLPAPTLFKPSISSLNSGERNNGYVSVSVVFHLFLKRSISLFPFWFPVRSAATSFWLLSVALISSISAAHRRLSVLWSSAVIASSLSFPLLFHFHGISLIEVSLTYFFSFFFSSIF